MKIKLLSNPKHWIAFVSKNKMEQRKYLNGFVSVLTANISVCYLNTLSSASRTSKNVSTNLNDIHHC